MRAGSQVEDWRTSPRSRGRQCSGKRWRRAILGFGIAALVLAQAGATQDPVLKTRPKPDRNREYLASHRMTMNVQVSDATGRPVGGLEARDFFLYDNDQLRKLTGFREIDGEALSDATEVVIVLDAVNSTQQALEAEKEGIFKYLAREHGPLPYPTSFVLWFNGQLKSSPPTTDRNEVGRAFVKMTKNVHSNTCSPMDNSVAQARGGGAAESLRNARMEERTTDAAHCLQVHYRDSLAALDGMARQQKTLGGRTILIWVGPGWPLLTGAEFDGATLTETTVSLLRHLRESQTTVDMITPPDSPQEETTRVNLGGMSVGAASTRGAESDTLALPVVARRTGGKVLNPGKSIADDLASCIHDADLYYALTFEMLPGRTPHEFHPLVVKVNRPDVQVRTVAEYYAEP